MYEDLKFILAIPVYTEVNQHYRLHAHTFHELVLVQDGRFRCRVAKEEHVAVPGDVLFYRAHTPHEEWAENNATVTTLACSFECSGFQEDEPVFRRDSQGKIQTLLTKLVTLCYFDEVNRYIKRCPRECPPILREMLAELELLRPHGPHAMVDKVRAFVRSHMAQPLSVDELADYVGYSKAHFSKVYRATTGHTPWQDIQRLRIEEAQRLIETTPLPLREIAPRVGIATEYHLSRLLKNLLGTSVRRLRHS